MALSADQIRANLTAFAARWGIGDWGERKEAQTYLNELFQCFGMDRREVAEFERFEAGGFFDLVWPGICLFEMKASKEAEHLNRHRVQAMTYWENAARPDEGVPAPEYVVLCAFQRFEIWQPGKFPKAPLTSTGHRTTPDVSHPFMAAPSAVERGRRPKRVSARAPATRCPRSTAPASRPGS